MKHKKAENLLFFIGCFLFAFSAVIGIMSVTVLNASHFYVAFRVFMLICIFYVIFYNKKTFLISLSIFLVCVIYVLRQYLKPEVPEYLTEWAYLLGRTRLFAAGYIEYREIYNLITINVICAVTSLLSVLLVKARIRLILLFLVGTGVFIFANTFSPKGIHAAYIIMLISLFIFIALKMRENKAMPPKMTGFMVLVSLSAVFMSYVLPAPVPVDDYFSPYTDTYDFLYRTFREPFAPKYYTSGTMGFSDPQGELGGWLRLNNDFIMYVYADKPVYLKGITRNTYTGSGWQAEDDDNFGEVITAADSVDPITDNISLLDVGYGSYGAMAERGMEISNLRVNIGNTRTGTVFQPSKTLFIEPDPGYRLTQNIMGDMRTGDIMNRNAGYNALYFDVDYNNEYILDILNESRQGYYNDKAGEYEKMAYRIPRDMLYIRERRILKLAELYRTEYAEYAEEVYDSYTELPYEPSHRVYGLAEEITAGLASDYDKLKAIEDYLQTYTYTLVPRAADEEMDFVEGFLFETKEGYCTYYASAMAVLARAAGLPSRYVEGYTTPRKLDGRDYFIITNLNAHAWAEVYLEGFGWVPFEATPPNYQALYFEDTTAEIYADNGEYYDVIDDSDMFRYYEGTGGGGIENNGQGLESIWERIGILRLCAVIFAAFILFVAARVAFVETEEKQVAHMDTRSGIIEYYRLLLRLLKFYGQGIRENESAVGYALRVGRYTPLGTNKIRIVSELFSEARYGGGEISEENYKFIRNTYNRLLIYFKKNTSKVKFFMFRYFTK